MKKINLIALLAFFSVLFSCSTNETEIVLEQNIEDINAQQTEIKTLEIQLNNTTYDITYFVNENGDVELINELPEELKEAQQNPEFVLKADKNNNLVLTDKKETSIDLATASFFGGGVNDIDDNTEFFAGLGLDRFNHYGFVSKDQNATMLQTAKDYKIYTWYKPVLSSYQYYLNGQDYDYDVSLVFGFARKDQVEVIQADVNENSIFGNYARENGSGFHHYGYSVKNLEKAMNNFEEKGYEPVIKGTFKTRGGLTSKLAFYDTREAVGAYTEIVNSKLLGFNVEQNQALLILGLFLGDTVIVYPS